MQTRVLFGLGTAFLSEVVLSKAISYNVPEKNSLAYFSIILMNINGKDI